MRASVRTAACGFLCLSMVVLVAREVGDITLASLRFVAISVTRKVPCRPEISMGLTPKTRSRLRTSPRHVQNLCAKASIGGTRLGRYDLTHPSFTEPRRTPRRRPTRNQTEDYRDLAPAEARERERQSEQPGSKQQVTVTQEQRAAEKFIGIKDAYLFHTQCFYNRRKGQTKKRITITQPSYRPQRPYHEAPPALRRPTVHITKTRPNQEMLAEINKRQERFLEPKKDKGNRNEDARRDLSFLYYFSKTPQCVICSKGRI
ncbi:hypothetical protein GGTG_10510 [Gaeumannomyces tritici R3-111a-1]|uniref:Uncharacterized protein n=1 Tax=Gaeumannomyces tritici (strain R3-111a-1) TaxID=644352 RepID=J3PAI4_GAET3|nr:hypothetical protein GGTG_10510 [Gaeumannomyces tritici R3-111a-1]EJT71250.1 hypothetical protein GGTG_10510 [Gaeumannomyces tritici R3-111a-1]